jgi:hypothetical protein
MSELKVNKISPETGTAITLGDSGDTFTVPSGANIVNSGTATGFGGGLVLQTKMVKLTTVSSFTANHTFADISGLSVAITPSSTDSKIWVQGTVSIGQNGYGGIRIVRDSTAIGVPTESISSRAGCTVGSQQSGAYECTPYPFNWIDAPSSTSSLTYKIQWHNSSAATVYVNRQHTDGDDPDNTRAVSTLIVCELSAATIS